MEWEEMHRMFEMIESGIVARIDAATHEPHHRLLYDRGILRFCMRVFDPEGTLGYCGIGTPFDLISAMGVTASPVEYFGRILCRAGSLTPALELAETMGFSTDTCSYHRGVYGATLQGLLPPPDFFIASSFICSSAMGLMESLARHFRKDLFVLHVPQENNEENVAYLADQYREMVRFISVHTGHGLDKERLRVAVENENAARELMLEVQALARAVPSPVNSRDFKSFAQGMALLMGSEESVSIATAYREAYSKRVANGESGIANEKLRILWIQNRIQFKNNLDKMIEEEFCANIVIDEINDILWEPVDPEDPFPGIARRIIGHSINGPIDNRLGHLQELARSYKVDGAINPTPWGCRQGAGSRGLVEAGLQEVGVPVLNLDVDPIDERNFSQGQLETRLGAFFEMLECNPSPWTDTVERD